MRRALGIALTLVALAGTACGGDDEAEALAAAEECYGLKFDECHKNSHVQEEDFTEYTCKIKDEKYPLAVDSDTGEAAC